MYAIGKGIDAKQKNATNAKETKKVIFEDQYDLQDESDCDKGYVDDVKCNGRKDNKNRCKDNDTSYKDVCSCKDDDTSYKDVCSCKDDDTSCKDDDTSYKDDDTSYKDEGSCRNIVMKSPMWPMKKQAKTDDNDGGRNLIGNNDDIVEVIDLCSYDDSEDDNDNQYNRID